MREFDVEVTMLNGATWFLHFDHFHTAGITDKPEAVIGNAIRGSGSVVLEAFPAAKIKKDAVFIVAQNIQSFKVVYR